MTDRIKGFTITLEEDIRIDDIKMIMEALQMVKGVAAVEPSIVNTDDIMARARVKYELRDKFAKFYSDTFATTKIF
jgi:hypothetical protein